MVMGLCGFVLDLQPVAVMVSTLFLMMVGLYSRLHLKEQGASFGYTGMTVVTTLLQILFAFLSWLIPLTVYERSLSQSMRVAFRRLPSSLLSNLVAAAIVALFYFVGFYRRKRKEDSDAITLSFAEGERIDV